MDVAYTSGALERASNCASKESPPMIKVHLSPEPSPSLLSPRPRSLPTLRIWDASSRVGQRMMAFGPGAGVPRLLNLCNSGTIYASVLPEPVRAIPKTSRGGVDRVDGKVVRCIGVGVLKPRSVRARVRAGETPNNVSCQRSPRTHPGPPKTPLLKVSACLLWQFYSTRVLKMDLELNLPMTESRLLP